MLEKRTVGDRLDDHDTEEVLVRYIYSNHLQSASLELDQHAAIISYEEYHPYGTTSFQSNDVTVHANAKRYRYTGKERDEESGLYYHGARYYIPWLCRWTAVDPLESKYAGMSPYNYGNCNPITYNDPSGMWGEKTDTVSDRKPGTGTASGYMEYSDGTPVNFFATQEETVIVANSVGKDIRDNPLKYSAYGLTHPFEAGFYSGVGAFLEDTVIGIGSFVEHPFASMDAMTQTLGTLGAYHLGGLSAVEGLPGGMETLASMSMSIDNAWNNFKNGDAYTKANYAGYATAFVASFFIPGGGEAKVAEAAEREIYLFRGTFRGAEGLPSLRKAGVTPTTPNPAKATVFATESERLGEGVVHIASGKDLNGILTTDGNVLAHLEEEIALSILPKDFAERAGITITSEQSRGILKTMGIDISRRISLTEINGLVREMRPMTSEQIAEYVKQAKAIIKTISENR